MAAAASQSTAANPLSILAASSATRGAAVLTKSRVSRRMVETYDMDNELAHQIYEFFTKREPLIDVCRHHRHSATFRGDMHIQWGGGDIDPILLNSPDEVNDLQALFKRALDYRDMFGMVPVLVESSATPGYANGVNGRPMLTIPPFGTGRFVVEYDPKRMELDVLYIVETETKTSKTRRSLGVTGGTQTKRLTRVLPVFVWPGYELAKSERTFQSRASRLRESYLRVEDLRQNMLDADFRAAHPVLFTQTRPDKRGVEEMTEEEAFGDAADGSIIGVGERQRYRRDVHNAERFEARAEEANRRSREGTAQHAMDSRSQRSTIDIQTMRSAPTHRQVGFTGEVYQIPDGNEASRGIVAQSRNDSLNWQREYQEDVCMTMGLMLAWVTGSGGTRIKGETDLMQRNVRQAVMQDRSDIDQFYKWAYEMVNHKADDELLVETLMVTDQKLRDQDISPDERKRMQKVRANVDKIAHMPARVSVVFPEDPLPKKVDLNIVNAAVAAGALTELEVGNLLRNELGLSSVDKDHDLMRNRGHDADTVAASVEDIIAPTTTGRAGAPASAGGGTGASTSAQPKSSGASASKAKAKPKESSASSGGSKEREQERERQKAKSKTSTSTGKRAASDSGGNNASDKREKKRSKEEKAKPKDDDGKKAKPKDDDKKKAKAKPKK